MLKYWLTGWVCYAEKTHGSYILPYISSTKSPQQVMGSLVKDHFATILGRQPDHIYHVTVMPCYDKKLEASRQDFYSDVYSTRDVDCVITTGISIANIWNSLTPLLLCLGCKMGMGFICSINTKLDSV